MSAQYNANSQQATRRAPGAQSDDPRRTSVVPRSHPAPVSPYDYLGDPSNATAYEDSTSTRAVYRQNPSPYLAQPHIISPAPLHQSPPRSTSLNYAQGNYYTLRSRQPMSQPGELSNSYAQQPTLNTVRRAGHGYRTSYSQSPGVEAITDGLANLATSPLGARWPTTPSPSDPVYATEASQSIPLTARGSIAPSNVISGTSSTHNTTLDPRYVVQKNPKSFFKVGRVFAILWHENEGSTGRGTQSYISEGPVYMGRFNEPVHSGIRRMVVVKALDQCAWCFPVSTYSRKGVAKAGVDASKHAVIYMQGTEPQVGSSEPHMTKEPLEVAPASPDQKLDHMSRLNFGKVYTVEHNVKVLPVGKITERSMPRFQNYAKNEFNIMA